MHQKRIVTALTYTCLAAACAFTFILPKTLTVAPTAASGGGGGIVLNGVIRDFSATHADFGNTPLNGLGHYAGSVSPWLPGTRRPAFVGGGAKVVTQWEDVSNRPIAPQLANVQGGLARETLGFRVNGEIEIKAETVVDAFNSNYGPYGNLGNFGMDATLSTNSTAADAVRVERKGYIRGDVRVGTGGTPSDVIKNEGIITGSQTTQPAPFDMPDVTIPDDPADLEDYEPTMSLSGNVTLTGDTNPDDDTDEPALHVGDFIINPGALVTIEGDLRIRVDRSFTIDRGAIELLPEANLAIWVSNVGGGTGDVIIKEESTVNIDPGDTTLVTINAIGPGELRIEKKSHVYATVVAPQRKMFVKDEAHFYGGLIADSIKIEKKGSGVHVDLGNAHLPPSNWALSVREKIELDNAQIDAFDSNDGPYGGANVLDNAWITTNAIQQKEKVHLKGGSIIDGDVLIGPYGDPDKVFKLEGGSVITGTMGQLAVPYPIPVVAPPAMGIPRVDEIVYDDGGTHILNTDLYCKKLKILSGTVVRCLGDVTIRVDDKAEIMNGAALELEPASTLTLYIKKELKVESNGKINGDSANPQLVSIRMMSLGKKGKLKIRGGAEVYAWTQGAKSELDIDNGEYYGSFTGKKVKIKGGGKMHVDMAYLGGCVSIFDTSGTYGPLEDGGITSAATFDEWYRTIIGVNQTRGHEITLTDDGFGVYEYLDDAFYPIDDKLLGNEGEAHNAHFTYQIAATFTYDECTGRFVEFEGGDGAWLFINGQLVMDLGGVSTAYEQYAELDRFGLTDGQTYDFRLFYAQRQTTDSVFRLRTNILLNSTNSIPMVSAQFD